MMGQPVYPRPRERSSLGELAGRTIVNDDENGVENPCAESPLQLRDHPTRPSPGHTSSSETTVTSSDSGIETLRMASGNLDCKSVCEKEEGTRSASAVIDTSSAQENSACQDLAREDAAMSHLEAGEERGTIEASRKDGVTGETEVSALPLATAKSVNFQQSDTCSANEKEVEAEFLRSSLALKCDWFTLDKRVKLEERSRDLAEENLKKEIANCLKLVESLGPLCEEDHQAQELLKKLETGIALLSQCATRVASRAEMLGAINQESRVSKAVGVMVQHVENLKRLYTKEHAELEELKQALLQDGRPSSPLVDQDDCQIKKRSSSLNSKPLSLRRVTIATLPRNLVSGVDNDRFNRRPSSWRMLGSKQSEQRPSLQRFISTYAWADAQDEKCDLKTKDEPDPPGEAASERSRKTSLSEKKGGQEQWGASSVCVAAASWAAQLTTSISGASKTLCVSVVFIVLFAGLMSFLTGSFFQTSVEAAPPEEGDSWVSLEHALWPFTGLRHNGPPPV